MKETTARGRELGHELRRRRERVGLSAVELADRLGWTYSKLSRLETGWRGAPETDVVHYLAMLGHSSEDMRAARALCRDLGYWLAGPESVEFHESTALSITAYCPESLPRWLETDKPMRPNPRRTYLLNERVLAEVSVERALKLLLLADMPFLSIQVVRGVFGGGFRVLEFLEHRPLVHVEAEFVGVLIEDHDAVAAYHTHMDHILEAALNEDASRELLVEVVARADALDR